MFRAVGNANSIIAPLLASFFVFQAISSPYTTASGAEESFITNTIPLGEEGWDNAPSGVVINYKTNLVYIASRNSDTITVINSTINEVIDIITVGREPWDLAINPYTNVVYTVNRIPSTVSIVNGTTNEVVATLDYAEYGTWSVQSIAVNTETNKVYVLLNNMLSRAALVSVIDGVSNEVESTFKVADLNPDYDVMESTRAIAVNSKTNMVYVTKDFDSLLVIDGSDNRVISTITVGRIPNSVGVNEQTNTIYVSNFGSQSVSVIDGSTNERIKTISVGYDPQGIAIDEITNTIYLTGYVDGVSIINGSSNVVEKTISAGKFPEGIAFNPNNGKVYVANAFSNSISVIDADDEGWQIKEIRTDIASYSVRYKVTSGEVASMLADLPAKAIMVTINSTTSAGELTIELPREIIDSKQDNGIEAGYEVFIGRLTENEGVKSAEFQEILKTEEKRMLVIGYPADAEYLTLVVIDGTYFVPEFGSFAAVVMAVAIVGVIAFVKLSSIYKVK